MPFEERWDRPEMTEEARPPDSIQVPDAPPLPGLTFRHYRGEEDLARFCDVYEACRKVDGFSWIVTLEELQNEFQHLQNLDVDRDIVVVEHEGEVIGYTKQSWVTELDNTIAYRHQQFLRPERRGHGIRRAMLHYCEDRALQVASDRPKGMKHQMSTWLCEEEKDLIAMLGQEGHAPARYFYEMVRDLREPIEDRPLPQGLEVRPVPEEDHRKVFFAANEALKDHWAGREWTEEDYQEFMNDPIIDPALWVVAYDGDQVAGTVLNWVHHEENLRLGRKWGYTEIITVRRPYRGKGLAKALITMSMPGRRHREPQRCPGPVHGAGLP
jgi:GNAT superfamily N-acetyltransferase